MLESIKKVSRMIVISQKELCYRALINNALRLGNDCSEYEANLANKERLVHILDIDVKRDLYGYYLLEDYKIYVSYGVNGNAGQMHYIGWIDSNNNQNSCYVYYTNINYNRD